MDSSRQSVPRGVRYPRGFTVAAMLRTVELTVRNRRISAKALLGRVWLDVLSIGAESTTELDVAHPLSDCSVCGMTSRVCWPINSRSHRVLPAGGILFQGSPEPFLAHSCSPSPPSLRFPAP